VAKPFLKWVGGKTQLLPEIKIKLPENIEELDTYVEPFLGGGAVLFYMLENHKFKHIYVSDINPELTLCYRIIKTNVSEVMASLEKLQSKFIPLTQEKRKVMFNTIRKEWNTGVGFIESDKENVWLINRVAQTVFLNRTCFNGLFRVNQKGEFNVPIGSYKSPRILDRSNLLLVSKALGKVSINTHSYDKKSNHINGNTFVYFDPPYRPLDASSSFTSYVKSGFNDDDQINLKNYYTKLSKKGAKLMLSNSDTSDMFFDELYSDFHITRVLARRNINSDGSKRGKINEIIVTNYSTNVQSVL